MSRKRRILAIIVPLLLVPLGLVGCTSSHRARSAQGGLPLAVHVRGNQLVNAAGRPVRLLGVDVDGTESACVLGRGFSWGPLTSREAESIASWGVTAVRVPLNEDCWLGINGVPGRYSGSAYISAIYNWVSDLNSAGIIAILDLHWSAPGADLANRQWPMPDADHSPTFWQSIATRFRSDPAVVFDVFNEPALGGTHPSAADWNCWRNGCHEGGSVCPPHVHQPSQSCHRISFETAGMQALVDSIRSAGARQPVMIGGLNWSADLCGPPPATRDPGECTWQAEGIRDPEHQLVASVHVYDGKACGSVSCWESSIATMAKDVPVVTGELGSTECSAAFLSQYMNWADAHGISYLVWDWFAPNSGRSQLQECSSSHPTALLSSWSGTPNHNNRQGLTVRTHLLQVDARSTFGTARL